LANLKISVNEIVDLKILIIVTPRVEKSFSNLDPTKVTDEFNDGVIGKVDDRSVVEVGALVECQGHVQTMHSIIIWFS
jgi:hypothetical protein